MQILNRAPRKIILSHEGVVYEFMPAATPLDVPDDILDEPDVQYYVDLDLFKIIDEPREKKAGRPKKD